MSGTEMGQFFTNRQDSKRKIDVTYIEVGGRDCRTFGKCCPLIADLDLSLDLWCEDSDDADDDESLFIELLGKIRTTEFVVIHCHGDATTSFRKFDRLKDLIDRIGKDTFYSGSCEEVNQEFRYMFKGTDREYLMMKTLINTGGDDNNRSKLLCICRYVAKLDIDVPPPIHHRMQGLYHPDLPDDITIDEYTARFDPEKPTVGIMVNISAWIKHNMDPTNNLIHAVEREGANVLCCIYVTSKCEETGSWGIARILDEWYKKDGMPRVQSLILTSGFSQITLSEPGSGDQDRYPDNFFEKLGVPVIQSLTVFRTKEDWKEDKIGLISSELSTSVIWPEFDGQITTVPLSFMKRTEDGGQTTESIPDRVHRIASLAVEWAKLRLLPPAERRIAFLFNMYPPTNDRIGGAAGLDTFESVQRCIAKMAEEGYVIDRVPADGKEILDEILAGVTNCTDWIPEDEIPERAADLVGLDLYMEWFCNVSSNAREGMVRSWGDPPGIISSYDGKFIIPGVRNGNVFIGMQPNRGMHKDMEALYHDPDIVMPHQYLAYYRWLKYVFKANNIIHVGTHGTIEWLPGKGNGLSEDCYPDVILDTMPNIYPYIVDDPGEGIQAKRRTNSVLIGHMCPSMTRADSYDDMSVLDSMLQEYLNSEKTGQYDKVKVLAADIHCMVKKLSMSKELGISEDCTVDEVEDVVDILYDYISDMKDALIKDGLHILGDVPCDELMTEMVYSLCRLRNGPVPSLRASIATQRGYDLDSLLDNPSAADKRTGIINGTVTDSIDKEFYNLLTECQKTGYRLGDSLTIAEEMFGTLSDDLRDSLTYVCEHIHPSILKLTDEIDNYMLGIGGHYVPPGPAGSPTRGNAHLLPTGSNFYSIDPDCIPTPGCWKIGKKMADDMIRKYMDANGKYPEEIGIIIWATDTMKTSGDDMAYIMSLIGVRPVWGKAGGKVVGLEVIPLCELGRPRIDVTARITSLFRDSFPSIVHQIDDAVNMIADLEEDDEKNFLKKHLREDLANNIMNGMSPAEANDIARIRIFGDPPGQHGCGIGSLIVSGDWDTVDDLARNYEAWGAFAYGRKWKGEKQVSAFKRRVGNMDVTVKNHNDREYDLLDIDDDYQYLGGLNAAVRSYTGKKPFSVMGDSSDVDRLKTRTLEEETAYVVRSRVLNPKWFEGLKRHGYKGAMELSKLTEYMLGWDATSGNMEDWMYQMVTEKYIMDRENRDWVNEVNPYAMKEMIEDMLEVIDRELWDAPEDIIERLRELYLESEGYLEEINGKK